MVLMKRVCAAALLLALTAPVLAQDRSTIRTITRSTATTSACDFDWTKILSSWAWPVAVVICAVLVIMNFERFGRAIRGAPLISKIGIGPLQVELDRSNLNRIQESTEASFAEILRKTNKELTAFSKSLLIPQKLEAASEAILAEKLKVGALPSEANVRFTAYISDTVFEDFLYQLTGYYIPKGSKAEGGIKPGRRFSKRYGIIGRSWRSESSKGVGQAFHGTQKQKEQLIEAWSMTEAEAEHGKRKPSCLAIVARDTTFNKPAGLIYVDGEKKDVFGSDADAETFAAACETLPEVRKFADALLDLEPLASQIRLNFDLAQSLN